MKPIAQNQAAFPTSVRCFPGFIFCQKGTSAASGEMPANEPPGQGTGRCDIFRNRRTRTRYQQLAAMPPVVADGHHGTQIEAGYGRNDNEPGLAFEADRLKGE